MAMRGSECGMKDVRIRFATWKLAAHKDVMKKRVESGCCDFRSLHSRSTICKHAQGKSRCEILELRDNVIIELAMLQTVVPVDCSSLTLSLWIVDALTCKSSLPH